MKSFTSCFLALAFSLFCLNTSLPAAALPIVPSDLGGWEQLGQRKIDYGLDKDEIVVTLQEGLFTAVKIHVKHAPINMHKMVIHFSNGDQQNVALKNKIPAGGSSRVIDLEGGKRAIKKVVFWYDTKNYGAKKAVLELYGRH